MNSTIMHSFFSQVTSEVAALDFFVEQQRQVSSAIRSRAWPELEKAMQQAQLAAAMVADEEEARLKVWRQLARDLNLPDDIDARQLCALVPLEYRGMISGACRNLRVATMRAKLENDALRSFAGSMAGNLSSILHELFPERKGSIYGKSGALRAAGNAPIVLDTAF
ncbi:MAG: hypothetical protein KKI09_11525 [Spirochaetes bacterium]|nr:hypothetical protein [Spirochaetota bacterium]MBU0956048.1 hypothetical protein [Spirochaetota bacterium]